jgi:hypothetical protein
MTRSHRFSRSVVVALLLACGGVAEARTLPCEFTAADAQRSPVGIQIAKTACREHADWHAPFIGLDGRAGWRDGRNPMEAEGGQDRLLDGTTPWKRVAIYWSSTPALDQMIAGKIHGAVECRTEATTWSAAAFCRSFIVDNPWSAAFVSHVMKVSGVNNFSFSRDHMGYLRAAYADAGKAGPYRLVAPSAEVPELGDLLCYSREGRVKTHRDLIALFERGGRELGTHCDVVVGVDLDRDSKLYVIGGNVLQAVAMRKLRLNARGVFSPPTVAAERGECRMNRDDDCSLNRKHWIALLKLRR